MQRKIWALICFALSVAMQFHLFAQGRVHPPLLLVPFVVALVAFVMPVIIPVVLIERYAFGFEPYGDGHGAVTLLFMTLTSTLIWFFPPRLARWFGTFNAFEESLWLRLHRWLRLPKWLRLPSLWRGAAYALDALNKRLFGRQKTGGWA